MKESLSMGNILPSGPVSGKSDTTNAGLDSTATKGEKEKKKRFFVGTEKKFR